jgi:hypothetical protein
MVFQLNLWSPADLTFIGIVITAYALGLVHGITPDEHTWPITFSYAVGSGNTKGGMKAGLIFSSGFTIQRAVMSEIAYFALAGIFMSAAAFGITYVIVGISMFAAGAYIKRKDIYPHWHTLEHWLGGIFSIHKHDKSDEKEELMHKKNPIMHEGKGKNEELKPVPGKLAFLHGIVAGFGFGAFALIIYTVLSPEMGSAWLGWIPGAMFGLGTMTMQIIFGAAFGKWLSKIKRLTKQGIGFVSRTISSDVLFYGGLAFAIAGASILLFPQILDYAIVTPIKVHNLHNLGIGFFIVILVVVIIGFLSYRKAINKAAELYSVKARSR